MTRAKRGHDNTYVQERRRGSRIPRPCDGVEHPHISISFAELTPFIMLLGDRRNSVTLFWGDPDSEHPRLPYNFPIFLRDRDEEAHAQIVVNYHPPSRKTTLHSNAMAVCSGRSMT
ncbi:hypothetical protein [Micromonospora zamorensis]|uniref:hypothetical protein n=1 Tax=Micromonospora zamorensis TaxID=709883 RepID=UPI0033D532E8